MVHSAAAARALFLAAPKRLQLLRTRQSIHLLECVLVQLLNLLRFLLGSERAVVAHRLHLGVHGLVNLPDLGHH
jgi:hypothetical protein